MFKFQSGVLLWQRDSTLSPSPRHLAGQIGRTYVKESLMQFLQGQAAGLESLQTYLSPEIGHSYLRSGTISHLIWFPKFLVMTATL